MRDYCYCTPTQEFVKSIIDYVRENGDININDLKWITPSEIPNYNFCPADADILEKILKNNM